MEDEEITTFLKGIRTCKAAGSHFQDDCEQQLFAVELAKGSSVDSPSAKWAGVYGDDLQPIPLYATLLAINCSFAMTDGTRVPPRSWPSQVVKWYKENGFDAIPIHPKESVVEGERFDVRKTPSTSRHKSDCLCLPHPSRRDTELNTIASVFDLVNAKETSLSVITPPAISLPIVKTSLLEVRQQREWSMANSLTCPLC